MYLIINKRSPYYQVVYKKAGGKWTAISTKETEKDKALEYLENFKEARDEVYAKRKREAHLSQYTVEMLMSKYLDYASSNFSKAYSDNQRVALNHLIDFLGKNTKLQRINSLTIDEFMIVLKERVPSSYRTYTRHLKAVFNTAIRWDIIEKSPFKHLRLSRSQQYKPCFIRENELHRIVEKITNAQARMAALMGFYTGMRRGEIVGIRWRHIKLEERKIIIGDFDLITKNKKQRMAPICDKLYNYLIEYKLKQKLTTDDSYCIAKDNGFPYADSTDIISKRFKKACRDAGISEKVHFHTLRHSFASNMAEAGAPLIFIKEILGHHSLTVTNIYTHAREDYMLDAVSKVFDDERADPQRRLLVGSTI